MSDDIEFIFEALADCANFNTAANTMRMMIRQRPESQRDGLLEILQFASRSRALEDEILEPYLPASSESDW